MKSTTVQLTLNYRGDKELAVQRAMHALGSVTNYQREDEGILSFSVVEKESAPDPDALGRGITITTGGDGLWSKVKKPVNITKMEPGFIASNKDDGYEGGLRYHGELRVFFDESWDTEKDGLIYTDKKFMSELERQLYREGFASVSEVDYSEQGMQGKNYVSLDIGHEFCLEWLERHPDTEVRNYD